MFAGRFSVSDRQRVDERRLTPPPKLRPVAHGWSNGLVKEAAYGKTVWSWHPWLVSNRRRFSRSPTGSCKTVNSQMTEARGIRLRGERGISRKTIAQGRPDALRWTCMLVCALLCAIAHETAGAARTRSSLRPPWARASVKPRAHRAARSRTHIQCRRPA